MNNINVKVKAVKVDIKKYNELDEMDQFIIDRHLDKNQAYDVEEIVKENDSHIFFLSGVINTGFNSDWFKIIN